MKDKPAYQANHINYFEAYPKVKLQITSGVLLKVKDMKINKLKLNKKSISAKLHFDHM